jgi:hypothetical protein
MFDHCEKITWTEFLAEPLHVRSDDACAPATACKRQCKTKPLASLRSLWAAMRPPRPAQGV